MSAKQGKQLQAKLRDAAKNQDQWDVPGLLNDAADRLDELEAFARSMLNPEDNAHAVTPHIRDEARRLLGMKPVETQK